MNAVSQLFQHYAKFGPCHHDNSSSVAYCSIPHCKSFFPARNNTQIYLFLGKHCKQELSAAANNINKLF
jgi:hypothetical protein